MAPHRQPPPVLARRIVTLLSILAVVAVVVAWVTMLNASAAPAADAPAATPMTITGVDVSRYPTVTATVSLPPCLADAGVTPADFHVDENGAARAATAHQLPGDELDVVLIVDTSGSMAGAPLAAAKSAAGAFLARMPATARVGVVGFGSTPVVASPMTTDRAALTAAVGGLTARGETALYDAVNVTLDQFRTGDHVRRHAVLLSDGGDTASGAPLDAVAARLAASGVRLDVAELVTAESRHDALVTLAGAGRGTVVPAADPGALTPIYDTLGRGLADQYVVEFPAQGQGSTRLRVTVEHAGQRAVAETAVDLPTAAAPAPDRPAEAASTTVASGPGVAALILGGALCFAALVILASVFLAGERRRAWLGRSTPGSSNALVSAVTERAVEVADEALERHGRQRGVNAALERAGIALRPGEFVVLSASGSAAALSVGTIVVGLAFGLLAAVGTVVLAVAALSLLATRRRRRFQAQLSDDLQLMAGSLRSGYAVLQAIDVVARETESPSAEEFRRVTVEARLGRDLTTSMQAMADRVGGEDFQWVVQAIEINREVGGDLADVLDGVAGTMRERERVRRQVKAVSAEGRLSAYVLVALPFFLAGVISVLNPSYLNELTHGRGLLLAIGGGVMLAIGSFWMSRMVKAVQY